MCTKAWNSYPFYDTHDPRDVVSEYTAVQKILLFSSGLVYQTAKLLFDQVWPDAKEMNEGKHPDRFDLQVQKAPGCANS